MIRLMEYIFNEKTYQWLIGGLLTCCGFLLGILMTGNKIEAHARITGHPVMEERVQRIEDNVDKFSKLAEENHTLLSPHHSQPLLN